MSADPETIAWYLQRSEALLDDLRERVQVLRARGGQLAGFAGAVLAPAGANLLDLIELTTNQGDDAERALRKAEYFFLAGLFAVAVTLAVLIVVMTV